MVDLQDMRALVEVITNGGFARAARRLRVAKSIVSRRIARIEAELGTTLLNRTTRGITPTEAGLEFGERAQRILDDLAEARDIVSCQNGEVAGRLRVSLPLSFGLRHMTPLLTALHAAHPRLELDVSYDDSVVDSVGGAFRCRHPNRKASRFYACRPSGRASQLDRRRQSGLFGKAQNSQSSEGSLRPRVSRLRGIARKAGLAVSVRQTTAKLLSSGPFPIGQWRRLDPGGRGRPRSGGSPRLHRV